MGQFQVLFKFILIYLKEKSTNNHQNAFKCATHVLTLGSQRVQLRRLLLSVCRTLRKDLLKNIFLQKMAGTMGHFRFCILGAKKKDILSIFKLKFKKRWVISNKNSFPTAYE